MLALFRFREKRGQDIRRYVLLVKRRGADLMLEGSLR
jgi:hypothetical protein